MTGLLTRTWARQAVAVIAVGAVVAFIGPFGSFDELSLGRRLLYWEIIANLSWWQWQALDWAGSRLDRRSLLTWWQRGVLVSLLTPWPVVVEVFLLRTAMGLRTGIPTFELYLWIAGTSLAVFATVAGFLHWARAEARGAEAQVAEVQVAEVQVAEVQVAEAQVAEAGLASAAPRDGEQRFLERLPMAKRGPLLCISAEDHYLRVYTEVGEELILLRLGDALGELEGADGLRVHRSHWVARRAVVASTREGRKTRLRLVNGLEIPVSETHLPTLKAAGWLS